MNRKDFDAHIAHWRESGLGTVETELFSNSVRHGPYIYGTIHVNGDAARDSMVALFKLAEDSEGYLCVHNGPGARYPQASIAISCHELTSDELISVESEF